MSKFTFVNCDALLLQFLILMDTNSINKLTTVSLLYCTLLYLKVQKGLLKCHCVNFFSNAVPSKVKIEKKMDGKKSMNGSSRVVGDTTRNHRRESKSLRKKAYFFVCGIQLYDISALKLVSPRSLLTHFDA